MLQKLCQLLAPFRNVSNRFRFMLELPTSRAQILSRARSVSDRFFCVFCAKSERESQARLVSPEKNPIKKLCIVRAQNKTKQIGNVFSLRGCQENPTLVKYPNRGRQNAH